MVNTTSTPIEEAKQILAGLKEAEFTLTQLPELARQLEKLPRVLDALKEEAEVKVAFKTYREETDQRLKTVQDALENQRTTLFMFQEDYKILLSQIREVLTRLDNYLRVHT